MESNDQQPEFQYKLKQRGKGGEKGTGKKIYRPPSNPQEISIRATEDAQNRKKSQILKVIPQQSQSVEHSIVSPKKTATVPEIMAQDNAFKRDAPGNSGNQIGRLKQYPQMKLEDFKINSEIYSQLEPETRTLYLFKDIIANEILQASNYYQQTPFPQVLKQIQYNMIELISQLIKMRQDSIQQSNAVTKQCDENKYIATQSKVIQKLINDCTQTLEDAAKIQSAFSSTKEYANLQFLIEEIAQKSNIVNVDNNIVNQLDREFQSIFKSYSSNLLEISGKNHSIDSRLGDQKQKMSFQDSEMNGMYSKLATEFWFDQSSIFEFDEFQWLKSQS